VTHDEAVRPSIGVTRTPPADPTSTLGSAAAFGDVAKADALDDGGPAVVVGLHRFGKREFVDPAPLFAMRFAQSVVDLEPGGRKP
jgi:hypothetical protein